MFPTRRGILLGVGLEVDSSTSSYSANQRRGFWLPRPLPPSLLYILEDLRAALTLISHVLPSLSRSFSSLD